MTITNKNNTLVEKNPKKNTNNLSEFQREQIVAFIKWLQQEYKKNTSVFEEYIKKPIIRNILKGETDPEQLIDNNLKVTSRTIHSSVLLAIFESHYNELLSQIVNMSDEDIARLPQSTLEKINSKNQQITTDIQTNGNFFQLYKSNLYDLVTGWIKECRDNPQEMRQKYANEKKDDTSDESDDSEIEDEVERKDKDKFYTLKPKKEDCKNKFDAYDNNGTIFVVTKVTDDGLEFQRIDEVTDEFKKEGREKRKAVQDARSKEAKRKRADDNYAGLSLDISEQELKNYADLLLKSLYTYYTDPASYLDDAETGEKFKQQLISGIMGGNYVNDKGQKIPTMSHTEAFNYWYDGCWFRTSSQSNKITNRGNRYMIEAYYIVNENNSKIGDGVDSAVEVANTALKDSKLADYNKIYSSAKIHIIKNHLGDIWKKASTLLLKSVPRQVGDLDNIENKVTKSSRITDIKSIKIDSTICSKVKTGHNETIFNWRVLTVDFTSNSSKLELQSVFCNGYDVSQLFSKDLKKVITIDNNEILSSNFYNKKYSKGDIVEGLRTNDVNLPTDVELLSFDDICDEFSTESHEVAVVNDIAHRIGLADNLDDMIILKCHNNQYSPEYLDFSDCRQFDNYMEYEFFGNDKPIKIYVTYLNSELFIIMRDTDQLFSWMKML